MPNQLENLHDKTRDELIQIFKDLPDEQESLILHDNKLGKRTANDLVQSFKELPANLTYLDISDNFLGNHSKSNLCEIFQALPNKLTSLQLGKNYFDKKSCDDLVAILQSLPKSIKILTISDLDINNRSIKDLITLGKALAHLKEVRLINIFGQPFSNSALVELNKHIGKGDKQKPAHLPGLSSQNDLLSKDSDGLRGLDISSKKAGFFHKKREKLEDSFAPLIPDSIASTDSSTL
jgi:hypothetical protein